MTVVNELVTKLSYKVDERGIKKFNKLLDRAAKKATKFERKLKKKKKVNIDFKPFTKFERKVKESEKDLGRFRKKAKRKIKFNVDSSATGKAKRNLKSTISATSRLRRAIAKPFTFRSKGTGKLKAVVGSIGKSIMAIGGRALTFGVGQAKTAIGVYGEFQSKLQELKAKGSEDAITSFKDLEKQAKKLGNTTRFSASQAADAQIELTKAGLSTTEVLKASAPVLALAANENIKLGKAAVQTSTLMNLWGKDTVGAVKATDLLATASKSAALDSTKFIAAMTNAAPTFKKLDQSVEDTGAAINLLAGIGIKGTKAGKQLEIGMRRLSVAQDGSTGKANAQGKALKKLGVNVRDASGKMKPFFKIVGDLKKSLPKLTKAQQDLALKQLFGGNAAGSFAAILGKTNKEIKAARQPFKDYTGNAQKMMDIMNRGLVPAQKGFESATEGLQLALVEKFAPSLEKIINKGADFIRTITKMVDGSEDFSKKFPTISKLVNQAKEAFKRLKPTIDEAVKKFKAMAPEIKRLGAKFGGQAIKNLEKFLEVSIELAPHLATIAMKVAEIGQEISNMSVGRLLDLLDRIANFKKDHKRGLEILSGDEPGKISDVSDGLKGMFDSVIQFTSASRLAKGFEKAGETAGSLFDSVAESLGTIGGKVDEHFNIWNIDFAALGVTTQEYFNDWKVGIQSMSESAKLYFQDWVTGVRELIGDNNQFFEDWLAGIESLKTSAKTFFEDWKRGAKSLLNSQFLKDWKSGLQTLVQNAQTLFNTLKRAAGVKMNNSPKSLGGKAGSNLSKKFSAAPTANLGAFQNSFGSLRSAGLNNTNNFDFKIGSISTTVQAQTGASATEIATQSSKTIVGAIQSQAQSLSRELPIRVPQVSAT